MLETGSNFDAAKRVYESCGFSACGPLLDYAPSEWTAFYEKTLRGFFTSFRDRGAIPGTQGHKLRRLPWVPDRAPRVRNDGQFAE